MVCCRDRDKETWRSQQRRDRKVERQKDEEIDRDKETEAWKPGDSGQRWRDGTMDK